LPERQSQLPLHGKAKRCATNDTSADPSILK
jgi:hypothetical protein